ncbi:hypothetical protein HAX54_032772 [Datura stramonium]|uniref:Uncharacterized protein n=1 Tax=Datura stramonium TaxID=4076 RepID=A0ABS8VDG8_DATST|nr:hypothetical protein [Datura stramonium]
MLSVGEWSPYPKGLPCVETIKLVGEIWCSEEKKDTILLVMMKQMELLTSYVKGFQAKNSHAIRAYDCGYYGNQCWKNFQFVDTSSQESIEVLPPHMENTLEVVLEKVLSTKDGVQDLWSKLLDLTTKVKSHEVIIQKLEEWMNELAFQIATPIAANFTAPRKDIMDDDVLEWETEEKAIEDLIVDVFLNVEELEEMHHVHKEIDKEAPMIKRARYIGNMNPPSPLESSHITTTPANANESQTSPAPDLLNIVQMAKMHENQLVRLAKVISSMIQSAFKKSLHPSKDKLTHLCSKVDVVESEMTTLQQEVAILTAPTNQPTPCGPKMVPPQVKEPISSPDD